jgi:gamma-glutamyltranspeptidase/glutathione hydrolase
MLLVIISSCATEKSLPSPDDPHKPYNYSARNGMVVAAHPLAAQAGVDVLQRGGNAIDAAVATVLALNAAEPFASGIGGGGFMVIYLAESKKTTVINYREKAPAAASADMFLENGEVNNTEGFIVSKTFSKINKDEYEKLLLNAGEASCYLNDGFPYEPGDTFRNPDLAAFFVRLAEKGMNDFYRGDTAKKIAAAIQAKGGILTPEDLAEYRVIEHSPLTGSYKDFKLFTTRPPSCGGLFIQQLLNIIENWPVKDWGHNSASYIHHFSEALRIVFADKARYLGDPDFVSVPIEDLISKTYATDIAALIQPDRLLSDYPYGEFDELADKKENTTHLCVIDKAGNIVSLTQSINMFFGTGIVPENTGFILNNHMADFSPDPESPNAPGPGRRPVSYMGPLILFRQGKPLLALGSPGGARIFSSLTQIIINIAEFGMSLDEAIEAPRFFSYSSQGREHFGRSTNSSGHNHRIGKYGP